MKKRLWVKMLFRIFLVSKVGAVVTKCVDDFMATSSRRTFADAADSMTIQYLIALFHGIGLRRPDSWPFNSHQTAL